MNVQAQRERMNLTQEALSEKSGLSIRTIQRIEAGTKPKGHTLKALARALEIEEAAFEESEFNDEIKSNVFWLKIINISSILIAFLPLISVIPPTIIMVAKKEFSPSAKQIITVQVLWSISAVTLFFISLPLKTWLGLSNDFTLLVMILIVLSNVIIILRNAAEIDRKGKLYFTLPFNLF